MFSQLIGSVDVNAAAVLCILFITLCVVLTTMIGKRRGRRELEMQFDVDKIKLRDDAAKIKHGQDQAHEYELAKLASERDVQFKRMETGLIEAKVNQPQSNYDR